MENTPLNPMKENIESRDKIKLSKSNYYDKQEWLQDLKPHFDKIGVFRIEAVKLYSICIQLSYKYNQTGSKSLYMLLEDLNNTKKKLKQAEDLINFKNIDKNSFDLDYFRKSLLNRLS